MVGSRVGEVHVPSKSGRIVIFTSFLPTCGGVAVLGRGVSKSREYAVLGQLICLFLVAGPFSLNCHADPDPISVSYTDAVTAHLNYVTEHSLDEYGDEHTMMWLSSIDLKTNRLPDRAPSPTRRPQSAWQAANLYWDQPTVVAARELARRSGCKCYEESVTYYTEDYLDRCLDQTSGYLVWGHSGFFDVKRDEARKISGQPAGLFPHSPDWDSMWQVDRQKTELTIDEILESVNQDAALSKIAVWIDAISWLAAKTNDRSGDLAQQLLQRARSVYARRHAETGLIETHQLQGQSLASTEVALLASSLIRAHAELNIAELEQMAAQLVERWLQYGFDPASQRFSASVLVTDGQRWAGNSIDGIKARILVEVFDPRPRPTSDFPMPMAEVCLTLYEQTQREVFREAVVRWVDQIKANLPVDESSGGYAEDYGRVIHFLVRAAEVLQERELRELAVTVADDAMRRLYVSKMGMFRSHFGEDRCDSVDGPGYLLMSLLYLDGDDPTEGSPLSF